MNDSYVWVMWRRNDLYVSCDVIITWLICVSRFTHEWFIRVSHVTWEWFICVMWRNRHMTHMCESFHTWMIHTCESCDVWMICMCRLMIRLLMMWRLPSRVWHVVWHVVWVMWHINDSYVWVMWHMNDSYVSCDDYRVMCVMWWFLIHMCHVTYTFYIFHGFICVPWRMCHMTHMKWRLPIHMCHMTIPGDTYKSVIVISYVSCDAYVTGHI